VAEENKGWFLHKHKQKHKRTHKAQGSHPEKAH